MEELNTIRDRLKQYHLSFVWLIYQLEQKGIITDKTEVSSVFSGTRKGSKANSIIYASMEILNEYEAGFTFGK